MKKLYETLGVPENASPNEIKSAYRQKAKETHPDTGGDPEKFADVSRAHAILISPEKRKKYDETGEVDDKVHNQATAAMEIIGGLIQQVADQVGERFEIDLVARMLLAIDQRCNTITADLQAKRREIDRLNRLARKFRAKKGKRNLLRNMVLSKVKNLEVTIASGERVLLDMAQAKEIIGHHSFDVDEHQFIITSPINIGTFSGTATC